MGALNFSFGDIYPNLGSGTTRLLTVPEAEDQTSLVDDQEMAQAAQVQHSPQASKNIILSLIIIFVVMVLLGWKF